MLGSLICKLPTLRRFRQFAVGLAMSCFALSTASAQTSDSNESKSATKKSSKAEVASLKIDTLKRDDFIMTSCGCAYYAPTSKREDGPMYLWINQKGDATIKVNGVARTMKVSSEERVHVNSKPQQGKIGAGDKVLMVLKGGNTSASITQTAERNCTVGPDCSVFKWQALMNLSEFEGRKSLTTWAVCGCPGRKLITAEIPKEEG